MLTDGAREVESGGIAGSTTNTHIRCLRTFVKCAENRTGLRTITHQRANGRTCTQILVTVGGVLYRPILNDEGDEILEDCSVTGFDYRLNPSGQHRFYLSVQLPCRPGDITTGSPLSHGDKAAGVVKAINRGEYLGFYPRRNDSESLHNQFKRRLTRLSAHRTRRPMLFNLRMSLLHNAAIRAFAVQRQGKPNPINGTG